MRLYGYPHVITIETVKFIGELQGTGNRRLKWFEFQLLRQRYLIEQDDPGDRSVRFR